MKTKDEIIAMLVAVGHSAQNLLQALDDGDCYAIEGQQEELSKALELLRKGTPTAPGHELSSGPEKAEDFFKW